MKCCCRVLNELSNLLNRKLKMSREAQSSTSSPCNEKNDFYDTQPLMKAARYLEQFDNSPNPAIGSQSCVYRSEGADFSVIIIISLSTCAFAPIVQVHGVQFLLGRGEENPATIKNFICCFLKQSFPK